MVELSFQGILPPPFKRGAYTLSKRNLSRCGGARRPPRPPARVPSYLEEGSGWEGLKCPPCLRTCVHHVSELNSALHPRLYSVARIRGLVFDTRISRIRGHSSMGVKRPS